MFKITVLDNNVWVSEGIRCYFKSKYVEVNMVQYNHLESALEKIYYSDVIVSELLIFNRKRPCSFENIMALRKTLRSKCMIILTTIEDEALVNYVRKKIPQATILNKKTKTCELALKIITKLTNGENTKEELKTKPGKLICLTDKEMEILQHLLMDRKINDIASHFRILPKTVCHHRKNIMLKLKCKSSIDLNNYIIKMKLKLGIDN